MRSYCGVALIHCADFEGAIEKLEVARRLSPIDPRDYITLNSLAGAYLFSRRFEETVRLTGLVLARMPANPISYRLRAAALVHLGQLQDAQEEVRRLLQIQPSAVVSPRPSSALRHPWMSNLINDALRRAGLPEGTSVAQ